MYMCKEIKGSAMILRPYHIVPNLFGGYAGPGNVCCLRINILRRVFKDASGKLSNPLTSIPGPLVIMNKKESVRRRKLITRLERV